MIDPFTTTRTATSDRRRYVRVPYLQPVTLACPGGKTHEARTTDISNGGVGIACRASFRVGEELVVTFRFKDPRVGALEESVHGRVVNFQADYESNRLGVEFDEPLHSSRNPVLSRVVGKL